MIRSLVNWGLGLAIISSGFAAFTQTPSASAAKPGNEPLPVYLLNFTASERLAYDACFGCPAAVAECLAERKTDYLSSKGFGSARLGSRRARSTDDSVATSDEIRQIDLEGLKKLLQRDPKDTRPLLVNFWATWCDPCREEFPDLVKIDNDYRVKNLNFVAVSLDDVSEINTEVPKFLKEMKAKMPVVLLNVNDPEPAIHVVDEKWDGQLPATFLYDKEGKVVFKHFGRIQPNELRAALDKEVGSKQ